MVCYICSFEMISVLILLFLTVATLNCVFPKAAFADMMADSPVTFPDEVTGDSIVATVLKKSEGDDDIVLRFFETAGDNAETEVKFFKPVARTAEVNLLERNDEELNSLEMEVAPFEIKTVKMSLQKKT